MKMKTLAMCLFAACCITEPAFAKVIVTPDAAGDAINVQGTAMHEKIQVVLLKPGFDVSDAENAAASVDKSELTNVIEYFEQITVNDNSIETYIPMRADAAKGKYLLIVENDIYPVCFASFDDRLTNMVPAAKAALKNGSFATFVGNDGKYFCESSLLENLTGTGNVAKYSAAILDEFKNSSDREFMSKLPEALNMGIVMEALNEKKADDFYLVRSMTDASGMAVPLDKADLIKPDKVNNIISGVSGKSFSSPAVYKRLLSESIFINVMYHASDMTNENKKDFFEAYAQQLGVNLTEYDKLSQNKRIEAIAKLLATNYTSMNTLQSSLDEICKDISKQPISGGGGGGGSSSGGGGGGTGTRAGNGGAAVINNNAAGNKAEAADNTLTDLFECEWAQPAIEHLISVGMIKGYSDNTFKPFKNISRAEFISIIARKYLPLDNSYTQSFSDVGSDSWCFDYVESAYNNGIINGKGNGAFAPDEEISRQDMASILYRLAGFLGREISGGSTEFLDDHNIAAYARDAVYSLKAAGIVNGYEDGSFNPNAAATRAEAAQMIYNFIKFLE